MNLAKYSLDNTKIVYFFLAVLLIGGILSFGRLGKKEDAPFVIKSAVIMTRYPGAEPAEVERLVTEPISREIQSMSGVYKIKSESMYGLSKITFELQPSLSAASIPQKWDELRRKVLNIQPQLPSGASTPTVSDDALFTPGTLTVALDTSDAPQAMQGTDGELTGYAVDAARALASRMGLKVAFVDASSADSVLGDKKADIFIGDINSTDDDISTLGTCLYDAAAVFGKTSDGESLSVSTETLNTATLGVQTSSASQEALAKQSITANQKTFSNINEC